MLDVTKGVIAHGCNAQGVMGAGVALAVKTKYPKAYHSYMHQCNYAKPLLGSVDLVKISDSLLIANCITQEFYGRDKDHMYVCYQAVDDSFTTLRNKLIQMNTHYDIHIPKIGSGLGGGDWNKISAIIQRCMPNHIITCWEL